MTDNNDISLFDDPEMMALFMELHSGNPREGPGDNESTLKALRSIPNLPERPDILDVGCGPGMQTLCLAEATGGNITALDYFPQFLDQLTTSAEERGLEKRITTIEACGYGALGHFTLPESSWWDGYYAHLRKGMEAMRQKDPDDEKVTALIHIEEEEQRMYREFSDYYGYEFYVMRKE